MTETTRLLMLRMFRREALAVRCYSRLVRKADRQYGQSEPLVSGVICDAWPEALKRRLRRLCRAQNRYCDAGLASRPRGMHLRTVLRLRKTMRDTD